MAELEEIICDKILLIIQTDVPEVKTSTFLDVKSTITDFNESALPAVQIWDVAQEIEHQRGFALVTWVLNLELVMKSTSDKAITQRDLWELRRQIELALWDKPNLEIPGVIHMLYRNNLTDLHLLKPFHTATMEFQVLFRRKLTGSC